MARPADTAPARPDKGQAASPARQQKLTAYCALAPCNPPTILPTMFEWTIRYFGGQNSTNSGVLLRFRWWAGRSRTERDSTWADAGSAIDASSQPDASTALRSFASLPHIEFFGDQVLVREHRGARNRPPRRPLGRPSSKDGRDQAPDLARMGEVR